MKTKVTVISEFLDIRVETLFAEVLYFQCFFSIYGLLSIKLRA